MNPLKTLRLEANLTQASVAQEINISPQSVLRYEQALYECPSTRIMKFYLSLDLPSEPTENSIITGYVNYQQSNRSYYGPQITNAYRETVLASTSSIQRPVGFSDFRRYVSGTSRIDFCKKLCIHPDVVREYEKSKNSNMPPLIKRVLMECGLKDFQVNYLVGIFSNG